MQPYGWRSHYYSSQGQKLKVQPNKVNMQKRKLKWGWNIDASTMLLKTSVHIKAFSRPSRVLESFLKIEGPYSN